MTTETNILYPHIQDLLGGRFNYVVTVPISSDLASAVRNVGYDVTGRDTLVYLPANSMYLVTTTIDGREVTGAGVSKDPIFRIILAYHNARRRSKLVEKGN